MILLGLARNALNFGVVVRWWLLFYEHLDWVHPIIHWFLFWLIYYHQILSDCLFVGFCYLDQRFR
jgi:hypothetical protein